MTTVTFPGMNIAVNINRVAFHVLGHPVYWYGIIIAVGFLLAVFYCCRKAPTFGIKTDDIFDMLIFAVPLGIVGARAYYVIFNHDLYRASESGGYDIGAMIRIWDGGLAIYGGIIAACLTCFVVCRVKKVSFLNFADLCCLGLLIGQFIGRWGNFFNVEAYGTETTLPWRMGIYDTVDGVYRYMEVHPTFLYESLWNLALFIFLAFFLAKRRKFKGELFFSYLSLYGLGRFFIEGLRTDSLYLFHTRLRVSQVLAGLLFVLVLIVLVIQLIRYRGKPYLVTEPAETKEGTEVELPDLSGESSMTNVSQTTCEVGKEKSEEETQ